MSALSSNQWSCQYRLKTVRACWLPYMIVYYYVIGLTDWSLLCLKKWHCLQTQGFVCRCKSAFLSVYFDRAGHSEFTSDIFVYICCTVHYVCAPHSSKTSQGNTCYDRNVGYNSTHCITINCNRVIVVFIFFQKAYRCGVKWLLFSVGLNRTDPISYHTSPSSSLIGILFGKYWEQLKCILRLETEWSLKRRSLDDFSLQVIIKRRLVEFLSFFKKTSKQFVWSLSGRGRSIKANMDQASGGDDPNKPSKKKSNEDEGRNKKLVCIHSEWWLHGSGLQRTVTFCNPPSKG